jgi:hypothetical protein
MTGNAGQGWRRALLSQITSPGPAPRRVHHPWNPPEAELPGIVAIDTLHF